MTTQHDTAVVNTENQVNTVTKQEQSLPLLRPVVDIHENEDYIALYAELPGVNQDDLTITIDQDNLLLEAKTTISSPADIKPVYAEFQAAQYKRSFSLSNDLDTEHVVAKLNYGILELKIPKKELTKPRKIEVMVA
jgi:HSP20 family molecular chaperone IbpA